MSFALLEQFRKNPVLFAGRWPIMAFDHQQYKDGTQSLKNSSGDGESFSVKGECRIAALDLIEKNGYLAMSVNLREAAAKIGAEDWMPFYYLPWITDATARTTLRPRSLTTREGAAKAKVIPQIPNNNKFKVDQNDQHSAVLDPNDPDVFITAAVNGCTVTIRGSREEPTVYHGNAKGTKDASGETGSIGHALMGRDAEANALMELKRQKMEGMLGGYEPKADRLAGPHTAVPSKMLAQPDYQMLVSSVGVAPSLKGAVSRISKDVATATGQKVKSVRLPSSQGTVFGMRTGRQWTFYYQKLVKYEFWHDTASLLSKAKWERDTSKPAGFQLIEFGEFWPNGPGRVVP